MLFEFQYLFSNDNEAWADSLTEPLAECLSEYLQTLQHALCWIDGAILKEEIKGKAGEKLTGEIQNQCFNEALTI